MNLPIPFNKPYMTGRELSNIAQAHFNGKLAGDGPFTHKCHQLIEQRIGASKALLTNSCTAALEMSAVLLNLVAGDEVIMPSYTFVSTANAFVLRGAHPVFVDIRDDTLNIDETKIEERVTSRTRAIVVVHYAGVCCEMNVIQDIANRHGLMIIEDAAHALVSTYRGRFAGTFGALSAFSFHETKNVICGEGGALVINDTGLAQRAEIIREKGTDRGLFFRGQVDKYTWRDIGSSYLPGELAAAFLAAQLEEVDNITERRRRLWDAYHSALQPLEGMGRIRRPVTPGDCEHNSHMYFILLPTEVMRKNLIDWLRQDDILAVFHYLPLHRSSFGSQFHSAGAPDLPVTDHMADRILRLPMWIGLEPHQTRVIDRVMGFPGFIGDQAQ